MTLTLASLPEDIHLIILTYLDAPSLLRLQLTSHTYLTTFTAPIYLRTLLRQSYPHALEVRSLPLHPPPSSQPPNLPHSLSPTLYPSSSPWQKIFPTIATRYHHLLTAQPRTLQHIPLRALDQSGHWHPPPQWDYHESQPGGRLYHESAAAHLKGMRQSTWKPYLFRPTLWSYDEGVVVYAAAVGSVPAAAKRSDGGMHGLSDGRADREGSSDRDVSFEKETEDRALRVLDIERGKSAAVPFDISGKIVRDVRLKEGVLVVEWAEKEPWHDLNMVDRVHRHFATAFNVTRRAPLNSNINDKQEKAEHEQIWSFDNTQSQTEAEIQSQTEAEIFVDFRSEWKIHFLGLPLSGRDHYFSTHTKTHYAIYIWQPNRSLWTGDEDQPLESLNIFDISQPCSYRPSTDPCNARRFHDPERGPRIVARFSFRELDFLGVRQHASISLMGLKLDSDNGTMTFLENAFVSGQGYFDPAERNWEAKCTTFPFLPSVQGPVLQRRGEIELPSYRGHCSMDSTDIEEVERWFLPIMDCVDDEAEVRFSLIETCFTGMMAENKIMLRVKVEGMWKGLADETVKEVGAMGRIAGDERWIIGQNSRLQLVLARFQ